MDLDQDGRSDIISGSWPGEIYFFRKLPDGNFAAAVALRDKDGKPINVGSASAVFAADWEGTGVPNLIVGTLTGEVQVVPNEGSKGAWKFGSPRPLMANGQPIKVRGDAAPVVADWDGDGRLDLILGSADGSVVWFRNIGAAGAPRLAGPTVLLPASPQSPSNDDRPGPKDWRSAIVWGQRVKPCVFDFNGDGRPDLLLGDMGGGFEARPSQTTQDRTEEQSANDELPGLRKKWSDAYVAYRALLDAQESSPDREKADYLRRVEEIRTTVRRLKDEIARVEEIQARFRPQNQSHGYVWLFLRKPLDANGPKSP